MCGACGRRVFPAGGSGEDGWEATPPPLSVCFSVFPFAMGTVGKLRDPGGKSHLETVPRSLSVLYHFQNGWKSELKMEKTPCLTYGCLLLHTLRATVLSDSHNLHVGEAGKELLAYLTKRETDSEKLAHSFTHSFTCTTFMAHWVETKMYMPEPLRISGEKKVNGMSSQGSSFRHIWARIQALSHL